MLMLMVAAAIAAPSPDTAPARAVGATVRATASVRILSGVSVSWSAPSAELPQMRLSQMRDASGAAQPMQLIEFE